MKDGLGTIPNNFRINFGLQVNGYFLNKKVLLFKK